MSKNKHTEGKWLTENGLMVKSESGTYVGYLEDFSDADAERVIACVNACVKFSNYDLSGNLLEMIEAAERSWEKTMMEAIGEDGPASVSYAIQRLRNERDEYKQLLEDHGPEGHNITNQQFVELRKELAATPDQTFADMCQLNVEYRARLTALEEIATALEADIDCGRPLEYSVEVLRDELIRTREVLGMLPEQLRKERC